MLDDCDTSSALPLLFGNEMDNGLFFLAQASNARLRKCFSASFMLRCLASSAIQKALPTI